MKLFKRIIAFALVLTLVMAGSALAGCTATITAGSLNVRAGVGTDFKVLTALPRNTEVYYLGVSDIDDNGDTWYKIQYGTYATGWVSSKYCELDPNALYVNYVKSEDGDVSIRSNPNLEGSWLEVLPEGKTAVYLNQVCTDLRGVDWYFINYNGLRGWVSSVYATIHSEKSDILAFIPNLPDFGATSGKLNVEGGDAFMREKPNLSGDDVTVLKEGTSLTYLNQRSMDNRGVVWFKCSKDEFTGWVSSRYAMLYGNAVITEDDSTAKYVKAAEGRCNVRKTPGLDGKVLEIMEMDEYATYQKQTAVDERGVTWYKVKFNGVTGWVSSTYADLEGFKAPASGSEKGKYVYATATANIRKEPNLTGKHIDEMYKDEVAVFTGTTSTDERGVKWYKIKFEGNTGWVSSKYTYVE